MSEPTIPIRNIYYLFCYAWNRFEEAKSISVGAESSPDLPNLLGRVLIDGTRTLLRRGLDRSYRSHQDELATVRGRIVLNSTIPLLARNARRLQCEFDELSYDVAHNQILKASLKRLAKAPSLDSSIAHELRVLAQRLQGVSDITLDRTRFARIQLHRNNLYYDFLLKVAELAFDCLLPDSQSGGYRFQDVLRDEKKMARVFEEFVRNFYRCEQRDFEVEPLTIQWDAIPLASNEVGKLPQMRVDVFLRGMQRKIIIDTKYYAEALRVYHGSPSFHSGNLYQIFSYLKNAAGRDGTFDSAEGMLLYPQVNDALDSSYRIQGHRIKIATLNLAQPWPHIHARLLSLIR